MAAAPTICLSADFYFPHNHLFSTTLRFKHVGKLLSPKPPLLRLSRNLKPPLFSLHGPHSYSSNSPTKSDLEIPLQTNQILSNDEYEKLRFLQNFEYLHQLEYGTLRVRVMRSDEIDLVADLVSESFAHSLILFGGYIPLTRLFVKLSMMKKISLLPNSATLIGFYTDKEGGTEEKEHLMAGTAEIFFDKRGVIGSLPTPTPPNNLPYICNMTVKNTIRRRGIGWHLLKACEKLICHMTTSREVYLHCRMIDAAPLNMYKKAGYRILKTDNIFILLMLQKRKHLMGKVLPALNTTSEAYCLSSNDDVSL